MELELTTIAGDPIRNPTPADVDRVVADTDLGPINLGFGPGKVRVTGVMMDGGASLVAWFDGKTVLTRPGQTSKEDFADLLKRGLETHVRPPGPWRESAVFHVLPSGGGRRGCLPGAGLLARLRGGG